MAPTQETLASESYRCYHCGLDSSGDSFKYFDNKKEDQPRFRCQHCHKFFTLGSHGRPQGKTYAKKRNEDPVELRSLSRQCRHCGVADNALFKYYNNHNLLQPRFKCLSCGKQFQMRLLGTGEERRLVHTLSKQTRAPYRQKQSVPEAFINAGGSSEDEIYRPYDGSLLAVPSDPLLPLEPSAHLVPEMSDEDAQFSDFLETELAEEEKIGADPLCWTGNEDNDPLPWTSNENNGNNPSLSSDLAEYLRFVEAELLTEENNEAVNVDAFSSTINVDGELPPAWNNKDAEAMDFSGAGVEDNEALDVEMVAGNMAEMVSESESTSNNAEVTCGTLEVEEPAPFGSDSWAWSPNVASMDLSGMSYLDGAAAWCRQMEMDMAHGNSMLPVAPM